MIKTMEYLSEHETEHLSEPATVQTTGFATEQRSVHWPDHVMEPTTDSETE